MTPDQIKKYEENMKVMLTYTAGHILTIMFLFIPLSLAFAWLIGPAYTFKQLLLYFVGAPILITFAVINPIINNSIKIPLIGQSFIRYFQGALISMAFGMNIYLFIAAYSGKL